MIQQIVTYGLTAICGYIAIQIKSLKKEAKAKEEKEEKEKKANRLGTRCLLRQQIKDYHDKYIDRGFITPHGYENLTEMIKAYEDLGGNGKVHKMAQELMALPIRE